VEFNPDNYDERNKFRTDRRPLPAAIPIYKGMRLYLTQNVLKSVDYVNGMGCEVLHWDNSTRQLRVKTDTGYVHMITPWTDVDHGRVSYYPVRLGYCSTIHKVQGDEFTHITIWLDTPKCEGAAYTALSRVSRAEQVLLGGVLTEDHFVPAG
jgi:ATP-dependent exoDNAse (exonuclease V) alpha subunit